MKEFNATFVELATVYALAAYSVAEEVYLYGVMQHALLVSILGLGFTLCLAFRSLDCIASALRIWWIRNMSL